jgi:sporulation protein YlmC with PRC-barrel domain
MQILKRARSAGAVVAIAGFPLLANAQTDTQPTSPAPGVPPAATQPAPSPMPPPATRPSTEPKRPVAGPADKSATAPKANPLIGLAVFSSDGSRLGTVQSVSAEPGGKVTAIHIKTGGFLGFGGKTVAIPEGKFTRAGDNVQLGMTSEEVSKLPEIKKES